MEVQKDAHHKFSYLAWQMAMSQAAVCVRVGEVKQLLGI